MSAPGTEPRLRRFLESLGDTAVVGLFATLASLPVVTGPAALAAAGAVLGDRDAGGSVLERYTTALRQRLGAGSRLALLALIPVAVGLVDVAWALDAPLTALRSGVLAAGVLLLLVTAAIISTACTLLLAPAPPAMSSLLHEASVGAAAGPHRALLLPLIVVAGAASLLVVPVALPLVPLLVGLLALSLRAIGPRSFLPRTPSARAHS